MIRPEKIVLADSFQNCSDRHGVFGKKIALSRVSVDYSLKLRAGSTTFLDSPDKLVRTGIAFVLETCFLNNLVHFRVSVYTNMQAVTFIVR